MCVEGGVFNRPSGKFSGLNRFKILSPAAVDLLTVRLFSPGRSQLIAQLIRCSPLAEMRIAGPVCVTNASPFLHSSQRSAATNSCAAYLACFEQSTQRSGVELCDTDTCYLIFRTDKIRINVACNGKGWKM